MSKESLEHLSSLMDGELSRDAGLFLTRRLSDDQAMCDTWERYHLIRDCIRQPGSKHVVTGLSVKLNKSLEAEELPSVTRRRDHRWIKPVSGLAIAASVALMAIVFTGPQGVDLQDPSNIAATPDVQPFVSPNTLVISPPSQAASFDANRLNAYLLRHNQMAKTAGRQGFVSFVSATANTADSSNSEELGSEAGVSENR